MAAENKLSELRKELPHYPTVRGTVTCDNFRKDLVMKKLKSNLGNMGVMSDIDGIRVDMEDGWILVRPSGTEPKIRITAEAKDGAEKMYKDIEMLVKEALN